MVTRNSKSSRLRDAVPGGDGRDRTRQTSRAAQCRTTYPGAASPSRRTVAHTHSQVGTLSELDRNPSEGCRAWEGCCAGAGTRAQHARDMCRPNQHTGTTSHHTAQAQHCISHSPWCRSARSFTLHCCRNLSACECPVSERARAFPDRA